MRRSMIGLLVPLLLGLLVIPLGAGAQPHPKLPRIGMLEGSYFWEIFQHALRDLGYVDGQTIAIDSRDAEGDLTRLAEAAAELVRLPVDILVTHGTPATRAAMHATTTIPIITAAVGDPLRAGIVASLARPGGTSRGRRSWARSSAPNDCRSCKRPCRPSRAWASSGIRRIRPTSCTLKTSRRGPGRWA